MVALSKSILFTRHTYRGGLEIKLRRLSEELNNVSILFGNHGTDSCWYSFYRRAGGIGPDTLSQKERSRGNHSKLE
jgi:hypothetical protein